MVDIYGLGAAVIDLVSEVDEFPKPDEKVNELKAPHYFPGGVIANYVTAAAKLGAELDISVGFIGAIGNDELAKVLLDSFENVNTECTLIKESRTPINKITVDKYGQKTIVQDYLMKRLKPTISDLKEKHIFEAISKAKLLHTSAIHYNITEKAVKVAKKHGLTVSIDLETQVIRDGNLENILSMADIFLPNKEGARELSGKNNLKHAAKYLLKEYNPDIVVITLGDKGCLLTIEEKQGIKQIEVPAYKVKVKDTTGAGDAFNAGFTIGYLKGWELKEIGRFANACAAMKIQHVGARGGLPTFKQVQAFQKTHKLRIK